MSLNEESSSEDAIEKDILLPEPDIDKEEEEEEEDEEEDDDDLLFNLSSRKANQYRKTRLQSKQNLQGSVEDVIDLSSDESSSEISEGLEIDEVSSGSQNGQSRNVALETPRQATSLGDSSDYDVEESGNKKSMVIKNLYIHLIC